MSGDCGFHVNTCVFLLEFSVEHLIKIYRTRLHSVIAAKWE